jgi:parallel beta-helix repeat protein
VRLGVGKVLEREATVNIAFARGHQVRRLLGALAGVAFGLTASPAFAVRIGNIWIAQNTVLNEDVIGSIEFKRGGISLDCQGHSIRWDASYSPWRCKDDAGTLQSCGISSKGFDNITIRNCTVWDANFGIGISVVNSHRPSILSSGGYGQAAGIYLQNTTAAHIGVESEGRSPEGYGLALVGTTDSYVQGNLFGFSYMGVYEIGGSFNQFLDNDMKYNDYGFYSRNSSGTVLNGNQQTRNNTYSGITINGGVGFLVGSGNIVNNNGNGIRVIGTSDSGEVAYNTALDNDNCDAYETSTPTNIYWHHNTFETRCNVPAQ